MHEWSEEVGPPITIPGTIYIWGDCTHEWRSSWRKCRIFSLSVWMGACAAQQIFALIFLPARRPFVGLGKAAGVPWIKWINQTNTSFLILFNSEIWLRLWHHPTVTVPALILVQIILQCFFHTDHECLLLLLSESSPHYDTHAGTANKSPSYAH